MAIIKADRIAESRKLASVSKAAFYAYALFAAGLRDDFGRFRYSGREAAHRLAPRRPDVTEAELEGFLEEYREAQLLRVWDVDGVQFAEWTGAVLRGNRQHHTPEPPWSTHRCSPRCRDSARAQADAWGTAAPEALPGDGVGPADTMPGDGEGPADTTPSDGRGSGALPFTPFSPNRNGTPPQPPSPAGEGGAGVQPVEPAAQERSLEAQVGQLLGVAARLAGERATAEWQRAWRRRIRARLRAGVDFAGVRAELEQVLAPVADDPGPLVLDAEATAVWEAVLDRLEPQVAPHSFAAWLRPTRGVLLEQHLGCPTLVVRVPSPQHASWLPGYARQILEAVRELRPGLEVRLVHAGPGAGAGVLLRAPEEAA